ncbi:MAG TPA: DUF1993 domain-containing protein [Rhodanobacteraceae bacterium]|nr:DUF1993 domain-containing protein [Rhodanobacteraceae bacterium]
MTTRQIDELKRVFLSRLDALNHILDVGEKHLPDLDAALQERLAPDMFPLGTQIAFACNQPRGFSQWCAGKPVDNLAKEVETVKVARSHIRQTRELVSAITASDAKLDDIKRVGLGPGMYCELPGHLYVGDYLLPNFYFHVTTAYAILRHLGAPLGKADFMTYLAPHVKHEGSA